MNKILLSVSAAAALTLAQGPARAADHFGKVAQDVHNHSSENCIQFKLKGVTIADSAVGVPGYREWFALPRSHPFFAELFAILLTGAAAGRTLNVHTSGATACNNAAVAIIALN
jgi:hypothetical protein